MTSAMTVDDVCDDSRWRWCRAPWRGVLQLTSQTPGRVRFDVRAPRRRWPRRRWRRLSQRKLSVGWAGRSMSAMTMTWALTRCAPTDESAWRQSTASTMATVTLVLQVRRSWGRHRWCRQQRWPTTPEGAVPTSWLGSWSPWWWRPRMTTQAKQAPTLTAERRANLGAGRRS